MREFCKGLIATAAGVAGNHCCADGPKNGDGEVRVRRQRPLMPCGAAGPSLPTEREGRGVGAAA